MSSKLLDEYGAGKHLGGEDNPISPRTLQRWRQTGDGPEFVKFGRHVRYTEAALDEYLSARRRISTSHKFAGAS